MNNNFERLWVRFGKLYFALILFGLVIGTPLIYFFTKYYEYGKNTIYCYNEFNFSYNEFILLKELDSSCEELKTNNVNCSFNSGLTMGESGSLIFSDPIRVEIEFYLCDSAIAKVKYGNFLFRKSYYTLTCNLHEYRLEDFEF